MYGPIRELSFNQFAAYFIERRPMTATEKKERADVARNNAPILEARADEFYRNNPELMGEEQA